TDPGTPVTGATLPSALPLSPGDLAAELSLDPSTIMPMETAAATVTVTSTDIVPSGLAVEALIDEVRHIVDGRTLVAPPSDTDLVLYRTDQGSMQAVFGLSATDAAREFPLTDGVRRIDIRALPEGVRTQDLLGPDGGSLLTPEGLGLVVAPGALDRVIGARLDAFDLDALPIALPDGLEAVNAALLDIGETGLGIPADLSFSGATEPLGQYLVLSPVEIDGATFWRLIGSAENSNDRISCGPAVDPTLPAPWVTMSGLYVLVRPTADDWAFISGTVFDIDGQPITTSMRVAATGGLQALVDIADGVYATAVPAGPVELEAENLQTRNLGATQTTALPGDHHQAVNIQLLITGPRVINTNPPDGAADRSPTTTVQVDFSEALDPASAGENALVVSVVVGLSAPQTWPGTLELSTDHTRLTYTPDAPYPSQASVGVTVSASLKDVQGYPLEGGAFGFNFSIEHFLLPNDVDPTKIRLYMPGRDLTNPENPVVEAAPGAVPGNIWLWVEDLDHDAATTTVQASTDGSFTLLLDPFDGVCGTEVGDRLLLHLLDSDGGEDLAVVPLAPWLTIDGLGAYFALDGGSFTTSEGIGVSVPFAALPEAGSVRVALADPIIDLPEAPAFSPARAAWTLELSDRPARPLSLEIPGPPPADPTNTLLVGRLITVAGTQVPMLVATAHWDEGRQLYLTTIVDAPGGKSGLEKAAADGVPDGILPGITAGGVYGLYEPIVPAGAKSDLLGRLQGENHILVDQMSGDQTQGGDEEAPTLDIAKIFADAGGNCAYVNTLYAPSDAVILARSEGDDGGAWAFSFLEAGENPYSGGAKAYGAGYGATLPLALDTSFVLTVVDAGTGYIFGEEGYAAPADGWVDVDPSDSPGMSGLPLKIIGGDPFTVIGFEATLGRTQPLADGIEMTLETADGAVTVNVSAGALPAGRKLRLMNLRNGVAKTLDQAPGMLSFPADDVDLGDPLILVVEGVVSAGDQALLLRFNKDVSEGLEESDFSIVPTSGGQPVTVHMVADGQTVTLSPDPSWKSGESYDLELATRPFSDAVLGAGQPLTTPVRLPLRMSDTPTGNAVLTGAVIADIALEGDLLLMAERDGGLRTYDISDPNNPKNRGYTSGIVGVGAVATDDFGQVLTVEGRIGEHVALRLYDLDELGGADNTQVGFQSTLGLSVPLAGVGPGDLELEVFNRTVAFSALEPSDGIVVHYDNDADPTEWTAIEVPTSLTTSFQPVFLYDGITGAEIFSGVVPEDGVVTIPNSHATPLTQPLILKTHVDTLAWAFASGGIFDGCRVDFTTDSRELVSHATVLNDALLDWVRNQGRAEACRDLGPEDLVHLGRLAVTPRDSSGNAVVLSATRHEGLFGFKQTEILDTVPDWAECKRRSGFGSDLNDVASVSWPIDGGAEGETETLVATVGHRELTLYTLAANLELDPTPVVTESLEWDPFRVAFDPMHRMVLIRDHDRRLKVYTLTLDESGATTINTVLDITLPEGAGMGPLVLDPTLGLAIAGSTPVQYVASTIEVIADGDGDGIFEPVEYLQPLGTPEAPAVDGRTPPYLAWVRARVLGVPQGTDEITVRVEGLAPGGAPSPNRPSPFLPSTTEIVLSRRPGLKLSDPGRHTFTSTRPILLIADERARTDYWQGLTDDQRSELSDESLLGEGVYPLCRNCGRDFDDDGTPDIPYQAA
ncbi:MAG: Ig-like domain-containing protein, partial [Acidobacteriota bacterium]